MAMRKRCLSDAIKQLHIGSQHGCDSMCKATQSSRKTSSQHGEEDEQHTLSWTAVGNWQLLERESQLYLMFWTLVGLICSCGLAIHYIQFRNLHGIYLGPLQICDSCASLPTWRASSGGGKGCPECFGCLPGTYSSYCADLSSLNRRRGPQSCLNLVCMLCWHPWEVFPFLNKTEYGDTDWEHSGSERKGMGEEKEGETTFRM